LIIVFKSLKVKRYRFYYLEKKGAGGVPNDCQPTSNLMFLFSLLFSSSLANI
jgi:hypothetical protein